MPPPLTPRVRRPRDPRAPAGRRRRLPRGPRALRTPRPRRRALRRPLVGAPVGRRRFRPPGRCPARLAPRLGRWHLSSGRRARTPSPGAGGPGHRWGPRSPRPTPSRGSLRRASDPSRPVWQCSPVARYMPRTPDDAYQTTLPTFAAGRAAVVDRLRALATRLNEFPLDTAADVLVLVEPAALQAFEQRAALALERAPAGAQLGRDTRPAVMQDSTDRHSHYSARPTRGRRGRGDGSARRPRGELFAGRTVARICV
jgi:hypothetical protein